MRRSDECSLKNKNFIHLQLGQTKQHKHQQEPWNLGNCNLNEIMTDSAESINFII